MHDFLVVEGIQIDGFQWYRQIIAYNEQVVVFFKNYLETYRSVNFKRVKRNKLSFLSKTRLSSDTTANSSADV